MRMDDQFPDAACNLCTKLAQRNRVERLALVPACREHVALIVRQHAQAGQDG